MLVRMTEPTAGSRRRTGLLLIAVLVLAGLVAGGVVVFGGGGHSKAAASRPTPSPSPASSPTPSSSPTPFDPNAIPAGTCFDSPGLSNTTTVRVVPCTGPHDAESVAVITLPKGLTAAGALLRATSTGCSRPLTTAWDRQPDKTSLHVWNRYPDLAAYRAGNVRATCAISASIDPGGAKLTAPLR
jgi:hypothetical protein